MASQGASCFACKQDIDARAEICPKCGVRQMHAAGAKSRSAAAILALFLGGIGVHKFYLGRPVQGVIYLLFCWTFIPAIIAFVEFLVYLFMSDASFAARFNQKKPPEAPKVAPPQERGFKEVPAPSAADDETRDPKSGIGFPSPKTVDGKLKIKYRDSSDEHSERVVTVLECDTEWSGGYLTGICHSRRAQRTFRIDRIREAVDMETGEVIGSLTSWAKKKYEQSPAYAVEKLLQESTDDLRALLYIAPEGISSEEELQIFLKYCQEKSGASLEMNNVIDIHENIEHPSPHAFKLICGRLAKVDEAERERVAHAAEAMIAASKNPDEFKLEAIEYMRKRFKSA